MEKILIIGLLTGLLGLLGCNSKTKDSDKLSRQTQTNSQKMTVTAETLKHVLEAFNRHDLDAIMQFFSDDCVLDMPRGPEVWGQRFVGREQVREALAGRFKGIPNVHYGEDHHWVAGDSGVSQWTLTGTTTSGVEVKVRGCDLWEFRNGKITRKDSYWKIVER
jgi:ketosteroid isomerase-like protein